MSRAPEAKDFTTIYTCPLKVRVADLNYGNHVGNDRILGFMHEARASWLADNNLSEIDVGGCGTIIAGAALDYKSQANLHQQLEVDLGVSSISNARFSLVYRIRCLTTQKVVALGVTDMGCFDYVRQKPVKIPPPLLALISH